MLDNFIDRIDFESNTDFSFIKGGLKDHIQWSLIDFTLTKNCKCKVLYNDIAFNFPRIEYKILHSFIKIDKPIKEPHGASMKIPNDKFSRKLRYLYDMMVLKSHWIYLGV